MEEFLAQLIIAVSFLLLIAAVIGYVSNFVKFIRTVVRKQPADTLFIGRVVGILIPFIGAVVGYF